MVYYSFYCYVYVVGEGEYEVGEFVGYVVCCESYVFIVGKFMCFFVEFFNGEDNFCEDDEVECSG